MNQCFKKVAAIAMAFTMTISSIAVASAAQDKSEVQFNGTVISNDVKTLEKNDKIYIAADTGAKALGMEGTVNETTYVGKKGATEIAFSADKAEMKINGAVRSIASLPFSQDGTLYIPLRDLCDALGYKVGWDASENTAIVLDVNSIVDSMGEFTIMDRYMERNKAFAEQNKAFKGSFDFSVGVKDGEESVNVTGNGTLEGVTADYKLDMGAVFNLNFNDIKKIMEQAGASADEVAALAQYETFTVDYIMDLNEGKYYIKMPMFAEMTGMSKNTWYMIDFNAMIDQAGLGMNYKTLIAAAKGGNMKEYLAQVVSTLPVDSVESYTMMQSMLQGMASMLADKSFTKDAQGYTSVTKQNEDGANVTVQMQFLTDANDAIVGCKIDMDMSVTPGDMSMKMSMLDNNEKSTATLTMSISDIIDFIMNFEMTYSDTTKVPSGKPADGESIMDVFKTMNTLSPMPISPMPEAPMPEQ